jgi:hypothetical protein
VDDHMDMKEEQQYETGKEVRELFCFVFGEPQM